MSSTLFVLTITCVTLSALAQLAMKLGMSAHPVQAVVADGAYGNLFAVVLQSPLVVAGLGAYAAGAGLWLVVLSKAELSLVYPFVGIGFILTMAFGWMFLHEHVGMYRLAGTVLIAFGACLVARS